MICTVYMHYNQLHIVENRYRLSVSALICYIISVIGISAKCCIGAPLINNRLNTTYFLHLLHTYSSCQSEVLYL